MKYISIYLFILFIVVYIILKELYKNSNVTLKYSYLDNREYFVIDEPDSQLACNQLALINNKIKKLFNYCKLDSGNKENVDRMIKYYNFDAFSELEPKSKYTAYSLNKGEKIKLCLRDDNMKLINDINSSIFVMCHELSHLMTVEEQHPPIFWENMKYILKKATESGIYNSIDYKKNPKKYGSNVINNNPLINTKKYPYLN